LDEEAIDWLGNRAAEKMGDQDKWQQWGQKRAFTTARRVRGRSVSETRLDTNPPAFIEAAIRTAANDPGEGVCTPMVSVFRRFRP